MERRQTRRLIIVIGAGRTGTSLLMQVLKNLGMTVSDRMTPPSEQNRMGGYEDSEVFTIQSEILKILNTNQLFPLPDDWLEHPQIHSKKNQLAKIITHQISDSPTIWGVKDPRTTLFLPLWMQIFNSEKIVPIYLFAVRSPGPTICSLKKQYNQSEPISELFWLYKNCASLAHTGSNCYIVHYEDWFTRPNEIGRELLKYTGLEKYFTGNVNETLKEVIRPNLNRSVHEEYEVQNEYVLKLYEMLKKCRGDDFDRAGLMTVVNECRIAMDGFKGWYLEAQKYIGQNNRLQHRLEKERQRVDEIGRARDKIRQQVEDLTRKVNEERQRADNLYLRTAQELALLKGSLSYKIGNTMVLSIKHPGWKTLRLPYDLISAIVHAFKGTNKKAAGIKKSPRSRISRPEAHLANAEKDIPTGNHPVEALKRLCKKRVSLAQEYNRASERIAKLEEQMENTGDATRSKLSYHQMTEAVLQTNRMLRQLKDIEDEITELKIRLYHGPNHMES